MKRAGCRGVLGIAGIEVRHSLARGFGDEVDLLVCQLLGQVGAQAHCTGRPGSYNYHPGAGSENVLYVI